MKKMAICVALALVLLGAGLPGEAFQLEQAQANLPLVQAYFYGDEPAGGWQLSASLDGEALAPGEVRLYDASLDSTDYIFLIDCSTSISSPQLEAVKQVVGGFAAGLGPNDTITLIPFGVAVEVPLFRSADVAAVQDAVAQLQPNQPGTVLFDAVARMLQLASQNEVAEKRKLCFVFTDSIDYNVGGYTKEEIESMVQTMGIPLYAMAFGTGTKESLDTMGAVARLSGGDISVVSEETLAAQFEAAMAHTQSAWVASFWAQSNRIAAPVQTFVLAESGQGAEGRMQIPVQFWQPDTEAPLAETVEQVGTDGIRVTFNETVQGAGDTGSYLITDSEQHPLTLLSATYDEKDRAATLVLAESPGSTTLSIAYPGITDVSMEQNAVSGTSALAFAAEAPAEADTSWMFLWWLVPLLCVTLIAVVAILAGRRKRDRAHEAAPDATKPTIDPQTGLPVVRLRVTDLDGHQQMLTRDIRQSLFVGRGHTSDIVFDDPLMDEQQFVIEENDGVYTITGLSDVFATLVNDEKIGIAHPLHHGDIIAAGRQVIVFE